MRLLLLPLLLLTVLSCFAQIQKTALQIGNRKMEFVVNSSCQVWRTVTDSVISCNSNPLPKSLGRSTGSMTIPVSELKTFRREIFNDNGCTWTRLTNDVVQYKNTSLEYINDSILVYELPRRCWSTDTVMQVNPVTLEEDMLTQSNKDYKSKYYIGNITKAELSNAINSRFGLNMDNEVTMLEAGLLIVGDSCYYIPINYKIPGQMEKAQKDVERLPHGTLVTLTSLKLVDANGLDLNKPESYRAMLEQGVVTMKIQDWKY